MTKELAFPIRDRVIPGESGQGYVLRMATANGLRGLPFVKACLGRSRFQTLEAQDAPSVSKWFGAPEGELAQALGRLSRKTEDEEFSYAGHDIGRSYFVNRGQPRVCPRCLSQHGYCRAEWDFVLVVACPQHACLLHDQCPVCTRVLDWNRPSFLNCQGVLQDAYESGQLRGRSPTHEPCLQPPHRKCWSIPREPAPRTLRHKSRSPNSSARQRICMSATGSSSRATGTMC